MSNLKNHPSKAKKLKTKNQVVAEKSKPVMSSLRDQAINYAKQGYRVFPTYGITEGRCDCNRADCQSPGKHPIGSLVPHGDKNATNDIAQIKAWWKKFPNANIGLAIDGFFVVDVDGERGKTSLKKLGKMPKTAKVSTGRGCHYYFKNDTRASMIKLDGIDIKTNGYMIAPPSNHVSGKKYVWVRPLSKMISPSVDLQQKLNAKESKKGGSTNSIFKKSSRNISLTSIAGFLRSKGLGDTAICGCLDEINRTTCKPPLDDQEVQRIAESVSRYPISDDEYFGELKDVTPRAVEFLVDPYIPFGCLSVIDGDPGVGKSYMTASLAAAVTTGGKWANIQIKEKGRVLFLSVEDDPDSVLHPRLTRQKADIEQVGYMSKAFSLGMDGIERLRRKLSKESYKLVIIDPVTAFMPASADMYRANEVRGFLMPLAEMAREFNVAILIVRHLRKAETDNAIHRGIGSIDFIAAVRSAMIFAKSPDEVDCRVLAHVKASYTPEGPSQIFGLHRKPGQVARMVWESTSTMSGEALLKAQINSTPAKLDGAEEFLRQILEEGPVPASVVKAQAAARGYSESTLKRARISIGVKSTNGRDAKMSLPEK